MIDPEIANPAGLGYLQNALAAQRQGQQQAFQNSLALRDQTLQERRQNLLDTQLQQQQQQGQAKINAEQTLAAARIVQQAAAKGQDPKTVAEQIAPNFVQDFDSQHGQGAWASLGSQDVLKMAQGLEQHAMVQLGQGPEKQQYMTLKEGEQAVPIDQYGRPQINSNPSTSPTQPAQTPPVSTSPVQSSGVIAVPEKVHLERKTREFGNQKQDYNFDPATGKETPVGDPYARPPPAAVTAAGSLTNDAKELAYQTYLQNGGKLPSARSAATQATLLDYIAKRAKEDGNTALSIMATGQANNASQSVVKDFTSGKTSQDIKALNTAVKHVEVLNPLIDALDNGNIGIANAAKNAFNNATGKPAPNDFNGVRDFVVGEISKAVLPSGGGEQERMALAERAKAASSPAILKSIVDKWQQLLAGKTEAARLQWDVGTRGNQGDFNKFLLPDTKKALGINDAAPNKTQSGATVSNW